MYKLLIRPFLFLFDPETIHHFSTSSLKFFLKLPGLKALTRKIFVSQSPSLERELFGLTFKSPVGLAAGFDKDAKFIEEFACLGFGFIEIGTLTPKPQDGNPKKRLFRVPSDLGLINRMGFNNGGVEAAVDRLKNTKSDVIIGGNIGKNKATPNENAIDDYEICFNALFDHVDYFVINVSSPNTPNLRELQEKEPLKKLLSHIKELNAEKSSPKPILLKIAPDLSDQQLDDIVEIVLETKIDGIIASNTTINRKVINTPSAKLESIGAGGLSGAPLKNRSTEVVRYINAKSSGEIPIIAVGGVFTGADAREKLQAGASLVQVYTGFIYEGPAMIKKINKYLLENVHK